MAVSLLTLGAMVAWGAILGFGYRLFLRVAAELRSPVAACFFYGLGGGVCFLATALFLYGVTGGKWGVYDLPGIILGFWLFVRCGRLRSRKIAELLVEAMRKCRRIFRSVIGKGSTLLLSPFAFFVDKGEKWGSCRKKKKRAKEETAADAVEEGISESS